MKKAIIISALLATSLLTTSAVKAESSKEQDIGFASGAISGGAVGGPVGFIVGGVIGAIFGNQTHQVNQLGEAQSELAAAKLRETQLMEKITMIQESLPLEAADESKVSWVSEGLTLNLMFTTNSSSLSDADQANIARIASIMHQFPELTLKLDGYSDPRGSKSANMLLSQRRVDAVFAAFEIEGVPADRLMGIAHGEISGLDNHSDMDAFALARKVSVNFVAKSASQLAQN